MTTGENHDPDLLAEELDRLAEDYLDGRLSPREAAQFERRLLEPAVADALGQALALRELLSALPPDQPPGALILQIERSLGVAEGEAYQPGRADDEESGSRFRRLRAAWGRMWARRSRPLGLEAGSTGDAVGSMAGLAAISFAGSAQAVTGLGSVGFAVPTRARPSLSSLPKPRLSWIRRVWRLRSKKKR